MQVKLAFCRVFQTTKLLAILIDWQAKTCSKRYRMKFKEQDRPKVYTVSKRYCSFISSISNKGRTVQCHVTRIPA